MSISTAAASARETARQTSGRFGEQPRTDPGQLGLAPGGPRPATATATAYYPGDDVAPDATVYCVVPDGHWGEVDVDEMAGDETSWLGPADRLADHLNPGEYTVYGADRGGRTTEFRVHVGQAPSAGQVADTLGARPGTDLAGPDGTTMRVRDVRELGESASGGCFMVGVDTDDATFAFESRPDGSLVPAGVSSFNRPLDETGKQIVAAGAADLAGRYWFRADTADLAVGPGRDATIAQWSPGQVTRWSDTPGEDVRACLRGRQRLARNALRRPSRSSGKTVGHYVQAAADARELGHDWTEQDERVAGLIAGELARRGRAR